MMNYYSNDAHNQVLKSNFQETIVVFPSYYRTVGNQVHSKISSYSHRAELIEFLRTVLIELKNPKKLKLLDNGKRAYPILTALR